LWLLVGVAFVLSLTPGIALAQPLSILLGAVLVALCALDALSGTGRASIVVERTVPAHLGMRRPLVLRYRIENRGERAIRVALLEAPLRTVSVSEEETIAIVPARSSVEIEIPALAVARGSDAFTRVYFWYENRYGMLRRRAVAELPEAIRVYPDLSAVERYGSLHVRNRLIEAGLRRMRMRGAGTEFESLREYGDGDAFRSIDWKATARRGRLMVVQREVERSQDVMMLLDCGRLMTARIGEQRKLDYAITAGLSLASIASLASDRVGVVAFARDILVARSPRSTASSIRALTDAICDVEPRFEESDYARAFRYVGSHLHRRSLVVLFSDVIDPVAQGIVLAELGSLARRHMVLCVFMNDAAVANVLATTPRSEDDRYRLDVAVGLAHERTVAARTLARQGIDVVDAPAAKLSIAAIDEYLRIKARGLL
jgi:uncharacterized protein (DUF58 family)